MLFYVIYTLMELLCFSVVILVYKLKLNETSKVLDLIAFTCLCWGLMNLLFWVLITVVMMAYGIKKYIEFGGDINLFIAKFKHYLDVTQ